MVRESEGERPIDWSFEESRVRGYEGRGASEVKGLFLIERDDASKGRERDSSEKLRYHSREGQNLNIKSDTFIF
jgi:hypothetical protein